MKIEIIFFDAGETLVHPHPSFSELFSEVARGHGYEIGADTVRAVQDRLAPRQLLQRQLATFVVQLLEPIDRLLPSRGGGGARKRGNNAGG